MKFKNYGVISALKQTINNGSVEKFIKIKLEKTIDGVKGVRRILNNIYCRKKKSFIFPCDKFIKIDSNLTVLLNRKCLFKLRKNNDKIEIISILYE